MSKIPRLSLTHGRRIFLLALGAGVPGVVTWWMWRHRAIPYTLSGHAWDILDRTHLLRRKVAASRGMVVCSAFAQNVVREGVPL